MFSGRLWNLFIDSFPKMFMHGLTVTIPLTVISFSLAMVIAIVVALVQFANIKVLKQICRFYSSCILCFLACRGSEFYSIHFQQQ